jgi:MtN3 and saliva related transmembrane protein
VTILIFSFLATFTSVVSLLPQIYKTYTTKSCDDISLFMLVNFSICSFSWVMYGVLTDSTTVWVANILMLLCEIIMIYMKLKYSKNTKYHGTKNINLS